MSAESIEMPTSSRTPEAEGLEVLVLGSFNPAIFHPEWFLRQKLIQDEDASQAKVIAVGSEVSEVHFCGLRLLCLRDRFALGTSNISQAARMQDLLALIFTLLSHIPVTACGIDPWAHYQLGSVDYWHKIGHTLAPKELIWNELLERPGMQSLTIKAQRGGDFPGEINVTVEPSARYMPGIFVLANYHYSLPKETVHAEGSERLLKFLRAEWNPACEMVRRVADKIFNKIKPDNA
jgi:hypothetical protein